MDAHVKGAGKLVTETVIFFYRCTVHFNINKVHTPTSALFMKLDKVLKFTLIFKQ